VVATVPFPTLPGAGPTGGDLFGLLDDGSPFVSRSLAFAIDDGGSAGAVRRSASEAGQDVFGGADADVESADDALRVARAWRGLWPFDMRPTTPPTMINAPNPTKAIVAVRGPPCLEAVTGSAEDSAVWALSRPTTRGLGVALRGLSVASISYPRAERSVFSIGVAVEGGPKGASAVWSSRTLL
jgi:hypothetical protein